MQLAQGDLLVTEIAEIPVGVVEVSAIGGVHIVAHSETGHHHVVDAHAGRVRYFRDTSNPLRAYLTVAADATMLRHLRHFDTHAPHSLPRGTYELRRQREHMPDGWRRVED